MFSDKFMHSSTWVLALSSINIILKYISLHNIFFFFHGKKYSTYQSQKIYFIIQALICNFQITGGKHVVAFFKACGFLSCRWVKAIAFSPLVFLPTGRVTCPLKGLKPGACFSFWECVSKRAGISSRGFICEMCCNKEKAAF